MSSRLDAVLWAGHHHAAETGARSITPPTQRPSSPPPGADYGQRGPVDFTGAAKKKDSSRSKSPTKKEINQAKKTAIKKGKAAQRSGSKSPPKQKPKPSSKSPPKSRPSLKDAGKKVMSGSKSPPKSRPSLKDAGKKVVAANKASSRDASPAKSRPSLKDAGKKVVAANKASSRDSSPASSRSPSPLTRQGATKDVRQTRPATQVKAEDFASFQDQIDAFDKDRQGDFTAYKEAEAEATKCIDARKEALKKFKKEMQGDADRLIESLAEGLKQKIKLLNELQAATADAAAKGEGDQGEILSLQSQLAEKEAQVKRLQEDVEEARENTVRETNEVRSRLESELTDEKLAHTTDQAKDKERIEELQKLYDEAKDKLSTAGDSEQKKYDELKVEYDSEMAAKEALTAQLEEAKANYEKLHEEVCAMLKKFEQQIPTSNSAN